ncbi:MAG: hypothetical protein JW395_1595 [Nitrospira sp.]|nr:hypothetical protein [Nitrospira sp.]
MTDFQGYHPACSFHRDISAPLDQTNEREAVGDVKKPQLRLNLPMLASLKTLFLESQRPRVLGSSATWDHSDDLHYRQAEIEQELQDFYDEVQEGRYRPHGAFDVDRDSCRTSHPFRCVLHQCLGKLLAAPVDEFVDSLQPIDVVPAHQFGVFTTLRTIERLVTDYGWHFVRVTRIEGIPNKLYVADCIADFAEYLLDPVERRLVGAMISGPPSRKAASGISWSNPLADAAGRLRLLHVLRGISPFDRDAKVLTLRHADQFVTVGAELESVEHATRDAVQAILRAGLSIHSDNVVDIRKKNLVLGDFTVRALYDEVQFELDRAAREDLVARLRHCQQCADPRAAAELTLMQRIFALAPGLSHSDPERAAKERRRFSRTVKVAGFVDLIGDTELRDLIDVAVTRWKEFSPLQDPVSLIDGAIPKRRLPVIPSSLPLQQAVPVLA